MEEKGRGNMKGIAKGLMSLLPRIYTISDTRLRRFAGRCTGRLRLERKPVNRPHESAGEIIFSSSSCCTRPRKKTTYYDGSECGVNVATLATPSLEQSHLGHGNTSSMAARGWAMILPMLFSLPVRFLLTRIGTVFRIATPAT
jgi:hypothetical protein